MQDRNEGDNAKNKTTPEAIKKAYTEAEKDIQLDPDINLEPKPEADLDEGELARFESGE